MDRVLPTVTPPATVTDGFGRRTNGIDSETGDEVELLEFAPELVEHSGFVSALGERVARFPPSATPRTFTCAGSIGRRPIDCSSSPI